MPNHRCRSFARAALALFALLPAAALPWSYTLPSPQPVDVQVVIADADAAGDTWAIGRIGAQQVLLRYPAGAATPSLAVPTGVAPFEPNAVIADDDGSALVVGRAWTDDDEIYCTALRYDATGKLLWQVTSAACASPPLDSSLAYVAPAPDATGERWVHFGLESLRLGRDGRVLARLSRPDAPHAVVATDARSGTLYFKRSEAAGNPSVVFVAHDKRGNEIWRWRSPAHHVSDAHAAVAPDGMLRVALWNNENMSLVAIDGNGRERWTTRVDTDYRQVSFGQRLVVGTDNATWVLYDGASPSAPVLRRFGADGVLQWSRTESELGRDEPMSVANVAPDGDVVFNHISGFTRVTASGTVKYNHVLPRLTDNPIDPGYRVFGFAPNGDTLLVSESSDIALAGDFRRLSRDGVELPAPSRLGAANSLIWANRALLPDGAQIVWTRSDNGGRELLRLSATGQVVWRRATPGTWSSGNGRLGDVAVRADRACTLDSQPRGENARAHIVECFRVDDGSLVFSREVKTAASFATAMLSRLHIDATGTISAWFEIAGMTIDVGFARLSRDGTPLASKTWPRTRLPATDQPEATSTPLIAGTELVVSDLAGNERGRRPADGIDFFSRFTFADDGSFLSISRPDPRVAELVVASHEATGARRWSTKLIRASSPLPERPIVIGNAVYVARCCSRDTASSDYERYLTKLSLTDGSIVWERKSTAAPFSKQRLQPAKGRDAVVAVGETAYAVTFDVIDGTAGDIVESHREACGGFGCTTLTPLTADDGSVHVLSIGMPAPSLLVRWKPSPPSTRVDQPGIAGAWWSPYANGEGFVLDYLPDSRTVFMPWFTFSREGGNDPAGQRWYVVQGAVPANATEVELPITESTGGAFDAGPSVTPTIVGTATLSFTDCDNGTLRYRFNDGHNGGASGTITLSRLSPATQNCVLADGSTQTRATTPTNGFDARMSGSWFEPATSGQGMQLTVQPGGIFFAPWFTFDPAGAGDDPGKQRWFTIQGSLAGAQGGVATLPIVQTIGGAFDSVPTNNMYSVGSATITMLACDRAKLDYRFDDNELAAAMRNRSGSIDLVKAGGCMR